MLHRFNGKDFTLWKYQLLVYLEANELVEVLDIANKPTDPERLLVWKKKDVQARCIITGSMELDQLNHVVTTLLQQKFGKSYAQFMNRLTSSSDFVDQLFTDRTVFHDAFDAVLSALFSSQKLRDTFSMPEWPEDLCKASWIRG